MKTIIVNGKEWKTKAPRASYENLAFICGYDPEDPGIIITFRAKVKLDLPGPKKEIGSYTGILSKGQDCVVCDRMVFNVSRM